MNTPRTGWGRGIVAAGAAVSLTVALGACAGPSALNGVPGAGPATSQVSAEPVDVGADADPGTVELVDTGSETPGGDQAHQAERRRVHRLRHVLHATWVTGGATPTSHAAIRGKVTSVSDEDITVKARDGVSMTFGVTSGTTVRKRVHGTGSPSSIDQVTVGDAALVSGVDRDRKTARLVVYRDRTA